MTLAWGARVTPEFRARVLRIGAQLGVDPSWLMAVMYFESRLDPAARNSQSGATGLIQFMPATAADLNTSTAALAAMSAVEQLDYVARYFERFAGKLATLNDCYMAVLWPVAVGKPDDHVLFATGTKAYAQNAGLDIDKDGRITKAEASSYVVRALADGLQPGNATDDQPQPAAPIEDRSTTYPTEETMGAIALPLLAQLLPQVLGLFSQRAQATIAEKTGADPKVAAQFMQNLIAQVGTATGITVTNDATATQAVAALTSLPADQKATKVAALEPKALATLDDLLRAGDKSSEWDAKRWAAELEGRKASSEVAIAEVKAGLWDMTKALVLSSEGLTWMVLIGTLAPVTIAVSMGKDTVAMALLGFAGTIVGAVLKNRSQPFDYRFDGTKESSEQTKALNKALDNGSRP